jgi:hypothetical protein
MYGRSGGIANLNRLLNLLRPNQAVVLMRWHDGDASRPSDVPLTL